MATKDQKSLLGSTTGRMRCVFLGKRMDASSMQYVTN